jgi:hypothetical protein
VDYVSGRGHILSGGGGGNSHNAGGAGGGNGSVGGSGGFGWQCNPSAGGIGGLDLSSHISAAQVFMGGGGGSGEGNNNLATAGGNGGGIILIRANSISTSSSCSGVSITANGADADDCTGNDGAGAGGAGGSVVLNVGSYSIDANCPLSVKASGGNGGSVPSSTAEHGGGGGGGMGVIIYSSTIPTTNVTNETDPGAGGSSGGSNTNPGDSGSGTVGGEEGVGDNDSSGPLPVSLLYFKLKSESDIVYLNWATASETNNMGFDIEKSINGKVWNRVDFVYGNGNSNELIEYSFVDNQPYSGISYYRLKQIDYNGAFEYSKVLSINITKTINHYFRIAPNPTKGMVYFKHNLDENYTLSIYSIDGRLMFSREMGKEELHMNINSLPLGMYIVEIQNRTLVIKKKIVLE